MNIEQPLVFRLGEIMTAFDRILGHVGRHCKCLSQVHFQRLLAYELMASPEILNYNDVVTTQHGHVYMHQRAAVSPTHHPEKMGYFVLRAPCLPLVVLLLDHYEPARGKNATFYKHMTETIVAHFPQQQCCWYNVSNKKACACQAMNLETQKQHAYVFCHKHWSLVLRHEEVDDTTPMYPPSETTLDEWLDMIV